MYQFAKPKQTNKKTHQILSAKIKKVHRGTLHEMIKNETNKSAKQQIETKALVTATSAAVPATEAATTISAKRQQPDIDNNRHATQYTSLQQRTVNKITDEVDDDDECNQKPLSKSDLIRKFDSKYKHSDSVDNKPAHRISYDENQAFQCATDSDEMENDENIQNSNSEEMTHDFEHRNRFSDCESITIANNNYANPNVNACSGGGGANANGNEAIPPKPLPRTSRNNSLSSLSSEHSLSIVANTIEDSTGRPVAKPRTTTTSYKVHPHTHKINFTFCSALHCAHSTRTRTHNFLFF